MGLALLTPVQAQVPPRPLPPDQSLLHLSDTAQRALPRDLLRATLAVEAADADPARLQAQINQRMSAALQRSKEVSAVTIETTGYSLYQERPEKAPPRWHGSQSVTLTSKDFPALLALVGALQQQGLVTQSLTPDLSPEALNGAEDALTDTALARLRQRAERVTATLGMAMRGFRDLNVGNAVAPGPLRIMPMMASVAAPSAAPPAVEPGVVMVSVTVSADFLLARH